MTDEIITAAAEFTEVNNTIRHYSNLRFFIMPVCFAINGAMLLSLQPDTLKAFPGWIFYSQVVAVGLFVAFAFLELTLDTYIRRFAGRAIELKEDCFWARRPAWKELVPTVMILMYLGVAVFWVMLPEPTVP